MILGVSSLTTSANVPSIHETFYTVPTIPRNDMSYVFVFDFKTIIRKRMEQYKNLGGDSGISFYEIDSDSIKVKFSDGGLYLYNHTRPGQVYVEQMKTLAVRGHGLNSLISRTIKKNYAAKLN